MKDPITVIPVKFSDFFPPAPKISAVEKASNQAYGKFSNAKNPLASALQTANTTQQAQQPPRNIEKGKGGLCDIVG